MIDSLKRARAGLSLLLVWIVGAVASADDRVFEQKVLPILQQRCVSCHNALDRKGSFSLQTRADFFDSGNVEPGKPDESPLLKWLTSSDGKRPAMPKTGESLKADEVAAIREWIAQGAKWPEGLTVEEAVVQEKDWWSFRPLEKPTVPRSVIDPKTQQQQALSAHPIDAFWQQKLIEQKLQRSPRAAPRVVLRRLYFDLWGLPPSPQEMAEFEQDCARLKFEVAYEMWVDRLLKSPHYGERWARHWLDVVKYADTAGYDKDKLRPNAWPYRDYVIRAFNDDKPFARFVQEQLAGDVLFPGTADGILGLGFIAAGPWDWIGHAEVSESKIDGKVARHTDRDEMVTNTLNTFCSVTIQCCQCHNHKFDPFTQEHYYNLQSIFAAVDKADRTYDIDPQVEQERNKLVEQLKIARDARTKLEAAIRKEGGVALVELEKRIVELQPKTQPQAKRPEFGYHSNIAPKADVIKWVEIDLGQEAEVSKVVLRPCHDEFNNIGAGFGFPARFTVSASATSVSEATLKNAVLPTVWHDASNQDVPNPGLAPIEIKVDGGKFQYIRVTAQRLALRQNDYILALAEVQVLNAAGENIALNAKVSALDSIEAPSRWRKSNLTDGIWASGSDPQAIKDLAAAQAKRQAIVDRVTTPERTRELQRLTQDIDAHDTRLRSLPTGKLVHAAATHFAPIANFVPTKGQPRPIHLLHRGNVLQPREASVPGTLPLLRDGAANSSPTNATTTSNEASLAQWVSYATTNNRGTFALPEKHAEGDRRAALAMWLTRRDHPLTWRSIVNRIWQHHFGRGLVETPNDFGRMGKAPTHPELLDWLAVEFRDNGQSFKRLHKLIVMSEVYQQSCAHHASNATIDSENRYLWRMNRRRLEAEEIRDAMLHVSGKLNPQMGGPGYYLFVLERAEHSPHYEYHKFNPDDAASHRRSIYRFIVRSQPDPYMTTLDCADSSQSTPQRNETLTSLQALSLLNNGFSLAMAKHFATSLGSTTDSLEAQVAVAFERATGRAASAKELSELTQYARQYGLVNVCRLLFNLSEFVYVD